MPGSIGFRLFGELHKRLLFAALAPDGGAPVISCGQLSSLIQPAGKNGSPAQTARLFGQDDENDLRDFLGFLRVAQLAQGR